MEKHPTLDDIGISFLIKRDYKLTKKDEKSLKRAFIRAEKDEGTLAKFKQLNKKLSDAKK